MDNITACAIAAREAGMSYGQYMAIKPQVQPIHRERQVPDPANTRICKNCGKEFYLSNRAHNAIYCGPVCSRQASSERARERERAKKNISNDDILICPRCGKSFVRGDRHAGAKYCSEECTAKRAQKKHKEMRPTASAEIIL